MEENEIKIDDEIVIIHTNDVHCGLLDYIGYDGLKLYKRELQQKYKYILTIDIGDHIQGSSIGVLSKGLDIINIMNEVGYNVTILGNHEFDYSLEALQNCNNILDNGGYICTNFCYRKNKTSVYPPLSLNLDKYVFANVVGVNTAIKPNFFPPISIILYGGNTDVLFFL